MEKDFKLRVIKPYTDLLFNQDLVIDDVIIVDKERATKLLNLGYVEIISIIKKEGKK